MFIGAKCDLNVDHCEGVVCEIDEYCVDGNLGYECVKTRDPNPNPGFDSTFVVRIIALGFVIMVGYFLFIVAPSNVKKAEQTKRDRKNRVGKGSNKTNKNSKNIKNRKNKSRK